MLDFILPSHNCKFSFLFIGNIGCKSRSVDFLLLERMSLCSLPYIGIKGNQSKDYYMKLFWLINQDKEVR